MRRTAWGWLRPLGGAVILAALVWRLGTGPFLAGVRGVGLGSLVAAAVIIAVTTACSAWRWCTVARGLGVGLPLRTAIAAYYRSQFLNSVLPGGVVGDVHRGIRQGQAAGDVARGLRAVAWERTAGQVVQVVLSVAVLLVLDSPLRGTVPWILGIGAGVCLLAAVLLRALPGRGPSLLARVVRAVRADVRDGLLSRTAWPRITAASLVAAAGHAAALVVAAWASGSTASLARLLPLAFVVLVATALPLNVGGWGPREGAAAWVFGAAGLGAGQGLAAATTYGVISLVAVLPGAAVLAADWLRSRRPDPEVRTGSPRAPALAAAGRNAAHG